MKIEKKDYDRIMAKVETMRVDKKKILDLPKYLYWMERNVPLKN